jgi:hypothetical protein
MESDKAYFSTWGGKPSNTIMADDLRAKNLDQLLAQAGQRPVLDRIGQRQRSHEVAQIVGTLDLAGGNATLSNLSGVGT